MKFKVFFYFFIITICSPSFSQDKQTLTVYTYDSFSSEWGPGPKLKEQFEAQCQCELNFVALDDALAVLGRLKLEGEDTPADVVVGLDMNTLTVAKETDLFAPHSLTLTDLSLPLSWEDDVFIPFDYGYFAFVYDSDKLSTPPQSFEELIENQQDLKLVIQDPRSSTPGLGLMLWIKTLYDDSAGEIWEKLSPSILTITPGWSEAYGLFLKGEADMVLSYTTSPAYHMMVEEKHNYKAAGFDQGHYIQIETAGIIKQSKNKALAGEFLSFLLSPQAQLTITTGNWMYPSALDQSNLPPAFAELISPEITLLLDPDTIAQNKSEWTEEFVNAVSK